jgi:ferric-dicitrate binding protein FerR (iron transport regulator)
MTHHDATPSRGTSPDRTERELREALEALAGGVLPDPDAYRTARGEWLRRERRRRLVLAVLVAVVFALATLIGLWVLNQAPSDPGVIFSGTGSPAASSLSLPRPLP